MKAILILSSFLFVVSAQASKNIQFSIGGRIQHANPEDIKLIRAKLGSFMSQQLIAKYMLLSIGIGDNFSACLTSIDNGSGEFMYNHLQSTPIHPETSLSVNYVQKCVREE